MFALALSCTLAGTVSIIIGICLAAIPAWTKVVFLSVIAMGAIGVLSVVSMSRR
jgi:hypothetical protein